MMSKEEIDYKLAAEQLRTGKPLFGKEGRDCKQGISVCPNPKASRTNPEQPTRTATRPLLLGSGTLYYSQVMSTIRFRIQD